LSLASAFSSFKLAPSSSPSGFCHLANNSFPTFTASWPNVLSSQRQFAPISSGPSLSSTHLATITSRSCIHHRRSCSCAVSAITYLQSQKNRAPSLEPPPPHQVRLTLISYSPFQLGSSLLILTSVSRTTRPFSHTRIGPCLSRSRLATISNNIS